MCVCVCVCVYTYAAVLLIENFTAYLCDFSPKK